MAFSIIRVAMFACCPLLTRDVVPGRLDQWKNVSQVMVVYDVSSRESFTSCAKWLKAVRDMRPAQPIQGTTRFRQWRRSEWLASRRAVMCLAGVLVANKIDLKEGGRAVVDSAEGMAFAKEMDLAFFETSAVRGGVGGVGGAARWLRSVLMLCLVVGVCS